MACCIPRLPPCPPRGRYVQPPVPKSFKPVSEYVTPTTPLEGCTIYRKSFCPPNCSDCRPAPMRMPDNLRPADCKMDANTTQKMSFQCPPCMEPTRPILPCNRNVIGEGRLSSITTQRHDYVPKPITKLLPIVPPTLLRCSEKPIEDVTIMQASYQPPLQHERLKSYKPISVYSKPEHPFQDETVQKLSYVPWPLKTKEHYPWACRGTYTSPQMPMETCSVMTGSYMGVTGDHRRSPLRPPQKENIISEDKDFECCTIYKKSFCPPNCSDCRPPPIRARDNLKPSDCKLEANTTQKMSFQCPPCVEPTRPILPCDRNVIGEGPLSAITTQRHDYVPKPITKLLPIKPPTLLRCSEKPLEGVTIMQASYQVPDSHERLKSYKPIGVYCKPDQPFQDETVQKLSYVPWPLKKKEHYPWACRGKFQNPTMPVEGTSVYKASYFSPGEFIPDGSCEPAPCAPPPPSVCKASCFGQCPQCIPVC